MPSVCVFAPSAPLTAFTSCSLHDHVNRHEAEDGEEKGFLLRLDAKGNRYVRCGPSGVSKIFSDMLVKVRDERGPGTVEHPTLSPKTILAFVAGKSWAVEQVEGRGDVLPLENITCDQTDVWFGRQRGKPVFAVLKRKDRDTVEACRRYLTRSGTFKLSDRASLNEIMHRPRLSDIWPRVFVQFVAMDPFDVGSGWLPHLSVTPPDDLPPTIVFRTIAAYMRGAWSSEPRVAGLTNSEHVILREFWENRGHLSRVLPALWGIAASMRKPSK